MGIPASNQVNFHSPATCPAPFLSPLSHEVSTSVRYFLFFHHPLLCSSTTYSSPLLEPRLLALQHLPPRLALAAPELPDVHHVPRPKVAVQVRAPVRPLHLVPLDARRGKVGQPQLENVDDRVVSEEEIGRRGDLLLVFFCVCWSGGQGVGYLFIYLLL